MISSLQHYFGEIEECEPLAYATYLDPRHKNMGFVTQNAADIIKDKLLFELRKNQGAQARPRQVVAQATTSADGPGLWDSYDEDNQTETVPTDDITEELEGYLTEPRLPRKKNAKQYNDPLEWWTSSAGRKFPNLCKMALKALIVPGTRDVIKHIF